METSIIELKTDGLTIGYADSNSNGFNLGIPDFTLKTGEIVCVLGMNGSGKSTLLHTLAALLHPASGTVKINDENIERLHLKRRAQMLSVCLTGASVSAGMRVRELVATGRIPYTAFLGRLDAVDEAIVEKVLRQMKIGHMAERQFGKLSQGEKQKCMLAKTMAQQTPLILLDEPGAHLDKASKVAVFQMLKSLAQSSHGLVIATHELELALRVAHKLILMGEKVVHGTVPALIENGALNKMYDAPGLKFDPDLMLLHPDF